MIPPYPQGVAVATAVAASSGSSPEDEDKDDGDGTYARLHDLASSAYRCLDSFGQSIEMGLDSSTVSNQREMDGGGYEDNALVSATDAAAAEAVGMGDAGARRERLRSTGRSLWMAVRSHPEVFRDNAVSDILVKGLGSEGPKESVSAAERAGEGGGERAHRAAAAGHVRSLSARLILVDHISTLGRPFPGLMQHPNPKSPTLIDGLEAETPSPLLSRASSSELEFGLRSLNHGGRAVLRHGSDPVSALRSLSLATSCWEGLRSKAEVNWGDANNADAAALVGQSLDEAFEATSLLPDAASLIGTNSISVGYSEGNGDDLGVLRQLNRLEAFVADHCCGGSKRGSGSDGRVGVGGVNGKALALASVQRYLPCLARVSYKHGNRFARMGDNAKAKASLKIAACATNRCLQQIRHHDGFKSDGSAVSSGLRQALQIQEMEMLVVSKECFYVLGHVLQSFGEKGQAKKCLERVEVIINEQRERDDDLYKDTMKKLGVGDGTADTDGLLSAYSSSDLALEGKLARHPWLVIVVAPHIAQPWSFGLPPPLSFSLFTLP